MSSVVQMFTSRPQAAARPRVTGSLEGGSYATARGDAAVSGAAGTFDYTVGAGRLVTDNRVPNNEFGNTTVFGNVGLSVGNNAVVRAIVRGEIERVGVPGATAFGRPDRDAFFRRRESIGGLTLDQQLSPALRHRASYSLSASRQQSTNLVADPPFVAAFQGRTASFESADFLNDSVTRLRRHHGRYQVDWRLTGGGSTGEQLVTALADWDGERIELENRQTAVGSDARRDNVGWSVQHQASWRQLFVTAGLRLDRNDSFGTAVVPRGSVVWVLRHGNGPLGETKLRASAGRGIKEPTVIQSFSNSPFFLGNPDLQPERARTIDAGIEQRFAGDRARVDLTWFDNRYRDIISLRSDPVTFFAQYFNIGLTRARGAELTADAAPMPALRVRGGYTFLDSEILESTSPTTVTFAPGRWAFRRPRHSGYAGVTVRAGRAAVDINGQFIGRYVDSDFAALQPPMLENPGHTVWDARVSVALTSALTATATVDNVGNADYMEPLGYPALGRAVRAGIRVAF
jgi:outer membrane cobalamin receptor